MSEKKPGFMDRLFGRPAAPPTKDEHEPPPGPPETTPEYIEKVEAQQKAEPPAAPAPRQSWLQRLTGGLRRTC